MKIKYFLLISLLMVSCLGFISATHSTSIVNNPTSVYIGDEVVIESLITNNGPDKIDFIRLSFPVRWVVQDCKEIDGWSVTYDEVSCLYKNGLFNPGESINLESKLLTMPLREGESLSTITTGSLVTRDISGNWNTPTFEFNILEGEPPKNNLTPILIIIVLIALVLIIKKIN